MSSRLEFSPLRNPLLISQSKADAMGKLHDLSDSLLTPFRFLATNGKLQKVSLKGNSIELTSKDIRAHRIAVRAMITLAAIIFFVPASVLALTGKKIAKCNASVKERARQAVEKYNESLQNAGVRNQQAITDRMNAETAGQMTEVNREGIRRKQQRDVKHQLSSLVGKLDSEMVAFYLEQLDGSSIRQHAIEELTKRVDACEHLLKEIPFQHEPTNENTELATTVTQRIQIIRERVVKTQGLIQEEEKQRRIENEQERLRQLEENRFKETAKRVKEAERNLRIAQKEDTIAAELTKRLDQLKMTADANAKQKKNVIKENYKAQIEKKLQEDLQHYHANLNNDPDYLAIIEQIGAEDLKIEEGLSNMTAEEKEAFERAYKDIQEKHKSVINELALSHIEGHTALMRIEADKQKVACDMNRCEEVNRQIVVATADIYAQLSEQEAEAKQEAKRELDQFIAA